MRVGIGLVGVVVTRGGDGAAANGVDDDDDGSDVLGRGYLCQSDAREFEFVRECTKHCASVCKM